MHRAGALVLGSALRLKRLTRLAIPVLLSTVSSIEMEKPMLPSRWRTTLVMRSLRGSVSFFFFVSVGDAAVAFVVAVVGFSTCTDQTRFAWMCTKNMTAYSGQHHAASNVYVVTPLTSGKVDREMLGAMDRRFTGDRRLADGELMRRSVAVVVYLLLFSDHCAVQARHEDGQVEDVGAEHRHHVCWAEAHAGRVVAEACAAAAGSPSAARSRWWPVVVCRLGRRRTRRGCLPARPKKAAECQEASPGCLFARRTSRGSTGVSYLARSEKSATMMTLQQRPQRVVGDSAMAVAMARIGSNSGYSVSTLLTLDISSSWRDCFSTDDEIEARVLEVLDPASAATARRCDRWGSLRGGGRRLCCRPTWRGMWVRHVGDDDLDQHGGDGLVVRLAAHCGAHDLKRGAELLADVAHGAEDEAARVVDNGEDARLEGVATAAVHDEAAAA